METLVELTAGSTPDLVIDVDVAVDFIVYCCPMPGSQMKEDGALGESALDNELLLRRVRSAGPEPRLLTAMIAFCRDGAASLLLLLLLLLPHCAVLQASASVGTCPRRPPTVQQTSGRPTS